MERPEEVQFLPAAGADALPDEMLTLIFSFVADGRILLDVLPLVCKQWHRVARDPASWKRVRLTVHDHITSVAADEARLLLHAPAAESLNIIPFVNPGFCFYWIAPRSRLRSALLRTRAVVGTVSTLRKPWGMARTGAEAERWHIYATDALALFLERQQGLRELGLVLVPYDADVLLRAAATLRSLRKLELYTSGRVEYKGELAGGLPELTRLVVHGMMQRDLLNPEPTDRLVADLVRGARALRVLHVDLPFFSNNHNTKAYLELRGLEEVWFNVFEDFQRRMPPLKSSVVRAVRVALLFISDMDTSALSNAVVSVCHEEHAMYSDKTREACFAVLDEGILPPHVDVELLMDGPDCEFCRRTGEKECLGWMSYAPWSDDDWDTGDESTDEEAEVNEEEEEEEVP